MLADDQVTFLENAVNVDVLRRQDIDPAQIGSCSTDVNPTRSPSSPFILCLVTRLSQGLRQKQEGLSARTQASVEEPNGSSLV